MAFWQFGLLGLLFFIVLLLFAFGARLRTTAQKKRRQQSVDNNISSSQNVRIINALDSAVIGDCLNSSKGERMIIDAIRNSHKSR